MAGYGTIPRATSETLRDGWLHTVTSVTWMPMDSCFVLGREKSVLISHDGEKYSPEGIEETIVAHSPFIEQVMLYNDHSAYTVGLIVPNKRCGPRVPQAPSFSCHTDEGQTAAVASSSIGDRSVSRRKQECGHVPRALVALRPLLSSAKDSTSRIVLMNSTMKIVRGRIAEFYKNRIDYALTAERKRRLQPPEQETSSSVLKERK